MKKSLFLFTSLLLAGTFTAFSLDLTPVLVRIYRNGRCFVHPYFQDGNDRYGIVLPAATSIFAEKGEAHLTFFSPGGGGLIMKSSPFKPNIPFEDGLNTYRQVAVSLSSNGATDLAIRKEIRDPIPINGWTSYQFIISGKYWGTRMDKAITFLNFNASDQILMITTADPENFEGALSKTTLIMNSLKRLSPYEDLCGANYP